MGRAASVVAPPRVAQDISPEKQDQQSAAIEPHVNRSIIIQVEDDSLSSSSTTAIQSTETRPSSKPQRCDCMQVLPRYVVHQIDTLLEFPRCFNEARELLHIHASIFVDAARKHSICTRHAKIWASALGFTGVKIKDQQYLSVLTKLAPFSKNNPLWHRGISRTGELAALVPRTLVNGTDFCTPSIMFMESRVPWDKIIEEIESTCGLPTNWRKLLENHGFIDIPEVFNLCWAHETLNFWGLWESEVVARQRPPTYMINWGHQFGILQQTLGQDLLFYLLNVLLRPNHPIKLALYPQPGIDTRKQSQAPADSDWVTSMNLHQTSGYDNSLMAATALQEESSHGCDLILHNAGGRTTIERFAHAYKAFHEHVHGAPLPNLPGHRLEMERFHQSSYRVEGLWIQCEPLPRFGGVRFMRPTVARAHQGCADRVVLMPTLLQILTNGDGSPVLENGLSMDKLRRIHESHYTSKRGPWGAIEPRRKVPSWPGWEFIRGTSPISDALIGQRAWNDVTVLAQLNILFGHDTAARWAEIERVRNVAAAVALAAFERLNYMEKHVWPVNNPDKGQSVLGKRKKAESSTEDVSNVREKKKFPVVKKSASVSERILSTT
ncbi:uncharacterized protein BP01DRAFT_394832 [Aspergillus saccharolyticus JOP 1030-1]|uniref:Uncharacterized protein n=1 Tax=Aspergillus saccharolyticus JOP 1030-1 TaxID=1450539 RepID=A0A318Z3C2_9EURO|nr:hypothetical protein BP01DRAFT_394832 [Aspergillus saccharolyticus JOP 1030-1]PYH41775.1 hypothetical protein BP01DRAFT_394832 [Aspergillus saccharolyticus JOP 1030-1]